MKLKIVMLMAVLCIVVFFSSEMLLPLLKGSYYAAPQSDKGTEQIYFDTYKLRMESFGLDELYRYEKSGQWKDDSDISLSAALTPQEEDTQQALAQSDESIVYLSPSWAVHYEDEQALMNVADLVVKAIVVQEVGSKFDKGRYSDYTTEAKLEITEVFKGEKTSGDIITISQMGGFDGEVLVIATCTTLLKEQQDVVLFLLQRSDGTYKTINENDGIYVLENEAYKNIGSGKQLNEQLMENTQ